MISLQHLTTAWTIWNLARKRVGPVGALLVTAVILGGFLYLKPRLAEKAPELTGVVEDAKRASIGSSE